MSLGSYMTYRFLKSASVCISFLFISTLPAAALDRVMGHGGPVKDVVVSPNDQLLASVSFDYSVVLWDTQSFQESHRLLGHDASVVTAAFSPNGRFLATGGDDFYTLIWDMSVIWDLEDPSPAAKFLHKGKIANITFSADSNLMASASWDGYLRVWSLEDMSLIAELAGHQGPVNAVQFLNDNTQLLSAGRDGHIRLWDLKEKRNTRSLVRNGWGVNVMHVDEKLRFIAYGTADGAMKIQSLDENDVSVTMASGKDPVLSIQYHPIFQKLAFGTAGGRVVIADMASSSVQNDFHITDGPVWGLTLFDNAEKLAVAGLDDFFTTLPVGISADDIEVEIPANRRFHPKLATMDNGARQFARKCSVCHSLEPNYKRRAGPTLYGIFGRKAGTAEGYTYSEALKNSDLIWDEITISDLFDHGPDVVTPGSKMPIQVIKNDSDLNDLVLFLKIATAPQN